jgi:hypothetical protein
MTYHAEQYLAGQFILVRHGIRAYGVSRNPTEPCQPFCLPPPK